MAPLRHAVTKCWQILCGYTRVTTTLASAPPWRTLSNWKTWSPSSNNKLVPTFQLPKPNVFIIEILVPTCYIPKPNIFINTHMGVPCSCRMYLGKGGVSSGAFTSVCLRPRVQYSCNRRRALNSTLHPAIFLEMVKFCLLYTSPSPRDRG